MNELKYERIDIEEDFFQPILHLQKTLLENIEKLQKSANLPTESQDVRLVTLSATKEIIVQSGWIAAAIFIATKSENFNSWQEFIDNKNVDIILAHKNMYDYLRRTLIIALHFHIDNMFRALLTELNEHPQKQGFKAYAGKLRE